MTPSELLAVLLALAVVCLGLALLLGHAIASRVLAVLGTVLAGVVALSDLINR